MRSRRRTSFVLTALSIALASIGAPACPPNEAVVCASRTENLGPGCAADYDLCAGGTNRIECRPVDAGVSCTCIESGNAKRSFQSNDACNVTSDTLRKRAAEGCGWTLE